MEDCNKELNCGINEVKIALFGDGEDDKGAIAKINEMHAVFTNTKWTTKIVLSICGSVAIITGSIVGVMELFKRIK